MRVFKRPLARHGAGLAPRLSKRQRGYLLIESMVAMAILATAIAALINSISDRTREASYLADAAYQRWVAENVLEEMKIERYWGGVGQQRKGDMQMGQVRFYWQSRLLEMQSTGMRRVDISVSRQQDAEFSATVSGFLGDPSLLQ